MNINAFHARLAREFYAWQSVAAYPRDPRRYIDVLDHVQGMTTPSCMHLLNLAVSCMEPGEVYLEAGTWRGATFIGALLGNDAHGYAIDNDAMDAPGSMGEEDHNHDRRRSRDVWRENIARFGLAERATYIDGSIPAVWERDDLTDGRPVGVYLFDGDKSTPEAAYHGLAGVATLLAPEALILVDDANTPQIRTAVWAFCERAHVCARVMLDIPTPANCWPGFWNGVMAIAWGTRDS